MYKATNPVGLPKTYIDDNQFGNKPLYLWYSRGAHKGSRSIHPVTSSRRWGPGKLCFTSIVGTIRKSHNKKTGDLSHTWNHRMLWSLESHNRISRPQKAHGFRQGNVDRSSCPCPWPEGLRDHHQDTYIKPNMSK